jgi:hypothetical protein
MFANLVTGTAVSLDGDTMPRPVAHLANLDLNLLVALREPLREGRAPGRPATLPAAPAPGRRIPELKAGLAGHDGADHGDADHDRQERAHREQDHRAITQSRHPIPLARCTCGRRVHYAPHHWSTADAALKRPGEPLSALSRTV